MDSRHQRLDTPDGRLGFPFVGSRTDRKIRCHDADAPCFGDARDHLAALGHADDFKIMAVADGFFSQDRNRIARRNQSLDVAVREVVGHLVHETDDILTGPVAIGRIERIAQKDEMFMGHELLQAAQDCQSANSGINDANRLLFIHDVSSSAIAQKKA